MAAQRRSDLILDSVKRLLRIGATANLLNLLQKQHPADLAQIFKSLLDNERQAVFSVLVERESQKPIVVGKGGAMIKAIGTAARRELERFFDARVFLDLRVKVRADWREDERMLDELGLPKAKGRRASRAARD